MVSAPNNENMGGEWNLRVTAVGPSALQVLGPFVVKNEVRGTDKVVNAEISVLDCAVDALKAGWKVCKKSA